MKIYSAQPAVFLARHEREERAVSPRALPPAQRIRPDRVGLDSCPWGAGCTWPEGRVSGSGRVLLRAVGLYCEPDGVQFWAQPELRAWDWASWDQLRGSRGWGALGSTRCPEGSTVADRLDELEAAANLRFHEPEFPPRPPAQAPRAGFRRAELQLYDHPAVVEAAEVARVAARIAHLEFAGQPMADVRWVEPADPVMCRFRRLELQRTPRDVALEIVLWDGRVAELRDRLSRLETDRNPILEGLGAQRAEEEALRRVQRRVFRLDPW